MSALLDGIVDDDPRAKTRVVALMYAIDAPLTVLSAVLFRPSNWIVVALVRFAVIGGMATFLWRRTRLRNWEPIIYLGVVPAAVVLGASALNDSASLDVRLAFTFVIPTIAGILYSRRVAIATSLCELAALTWVSFAASSLDHAVANFVGFSVVFAVIVAVVNGTALRLRRAVAELRAAQADRDRVQLAVDHATELERARIATELHDDTIQVMTAASLKLDVVKARHSDGEQLDEALDLMQQAISRARRLSFDLYPPALDDGLAPALREIGARFDRDGGASVSVSGRCDRYPAEVERLVYRTAKELLENARRHAHASAITVSVRRAGGGVSLEVVDDGVGFDGARGACDGEFHFGLRAADERVRRAGGRLTIDSTVGHGTRVLMWLPVAAEKSVTEDGERGLLRSDRPMEPPA